MSNEGYEKALIWLKNLNLPKPAPLVPSEMTDQELARLRFTSVSPEEEELVMEELKKRGFAL